MIHIRHNDTRPIPTNPFATSRIMPTGSPYLFDDESSAEQLADTLEDNRWRGQIIGAHGSGKSTLLHTLLPEFERRNRTIDVHTLRDGQRKLDSGGLRQRRSKRSLLIVDGYEQLCRTERLRLAWHCRRTGAGLLVTTHTPVRMPTLVELLPTLTTAQGVVNHLLAEHPDEHIVAEDIQRCFKQHNGNMREMLFSLYDIYEQRRSTQSNTIDTNGASVECNHR